MPDPKPNKPADKPHDVEPLGGGTGEPPPPPPPPDPPQDEEPTG